LSPEKYWRKCVDLLVFHGLALAFGQRRHILVPHY
jgi:hypothetical protein